MTKITKADQNKININLPGESMKINSRNILEIGNFSAEELAGEYGTPLLVLDEKEIRKNIRKYIDTFSENYPDFKVLYAGKAFLNRTLCRILQQEGTGLDVVSGGELYIALNADFDPEDIYFHGNNKLKSEIELGLQNNVGKFVVDNFYEIELLNKLAKKLGKKPEVILRIIPGIEAHTHEYIQTGQIDSKFGVGLKNNEAKKLIKKIIKYNNLDLKGIHAHIGSQIFTLESYEKLIEIIFDFLVQIKEETGKILKEIDLGGGLGISHTKDENPPSIEKYVETISNKVKEEADIKNFPLPKLSVEPGRSIIGPAGITLYEIGSIKEVPGGSKYVAIDGGMTDNIRPALYDAEYEAFTANHCLQGEKEKVTIAGKCCESGDILIKDIQITEPKSGDILAVPSTGAYTYSMASNYNGIPRPAVVLVCEDKSNIIIKRESYEDLIKNDIIPEDY